MAKLKRIFISIGLLRNFAFFLIRQSLRAKGNVIGQKVKIGFSTFCEGKNMIAQNNSIFGSYIGYGTYIGPNSHFSKTKIGRYCSIGHNVSCIFGKHPTKDFVSTHPAFFSTNHPIGFTYVTENLFKEYSNCRDIENKYPIVVGNDVWIADNVTIMEGVVIGDGAIVAANALVTKDVPPYTIVGGVPAKIIKKRFSEDEIQFLLDLKWWDRPENWIKENAVYFDNIEKLQAKLNNEQ